MSTKATNSQNTLQIKNGLGKPKKKLSKRKINSKQPGLIPVKQILVAVGVTCFFEVHIQFIFIVVVFVLDNAHAFFVIPGCIMCDTTFLCILRYVVN